MHFLDNFSFEISKICVGKLEICSPEKKENERKFQTFSEFRSLRSQWAATVGLLNEWTACLKFPTGRLKIFSKDLVYIYWVKSHVRDLEGSIEGKLWRIGKAHEHEKLIKII